MRSSSLAAWRLRPDTATERVIDAEPYQQVCSLTESTTCVYDPGSAIVRIKASSDRFIGLRIAAAGTRRVRPDAVVPLGAYANYDFFATAGSARLRGLYTDANLFSHYGNGYLRTGLLSTERGTFLTARSMGWQWDLPDSASSVTVGSFYGGGSTQRPIVPMVGVRYGSDYALRPDISLVPRPRVSSSVNQPSRADLYVDGLYRRSGEVPYGRFDVEADALLSGLGSLQVELTDQRGVKTVETLAYYFAPQLLPQGLTEFSTEVGVVSPDPVRLSTSSVPVLSGTLRSGWTTSHTVTATALASRNHGLIGWVSDCQWDLRGVLRSGLSLVRRSTGTNARALIGHEFQSRRLSTFIRLEAETGHHETRSERHPFRPLGPRGASSILPSDRHALTAALSLAVNERHQFAASLIDRVSVFGQRNQALALSATYRPSNRIQISLSLQQVRQPSSGTFAFLTLVMPLGDRHLAATSATQGPEGTSAQWMVQSLRDGTREDNMAQYRVFGERGRRDSVGASYQRNESFGQWTVEGESAHGQSMASVRLSGAVGWMAGSAFATRRIDDSFIVVDGDGQPGLPVFFENRAVGVTDSAGFLVIPEARAYHPNHVSIDGSAIPIDFTLAQDQLQTVPRRRSGAIARFEISDGGALVAVRQADGSPVPSGAQATISTQTRSTAVGSRSEVFVNRADRRADVVLSWPGRECRFEYLPTAADAKSPGAPLPTGEPWRCL